MSVMQRHGARAAIDAAAPRLATPGAARVARCARRAGAAAAGPLPRPMLERRQRLIPTVAVTDEQATVDTDAPVEPQLGVEPINWYQQWYPLAIAGDLDKTRPTPAKLLGRSLVVWWDANAGLWSVMEDRCPHRLAPLSEGRLEPKTGNLMCSYHGWQFDGSGACTAIPQIGDDKAKAVAFGSKRSCVTTYPSKVVQGLLWVWADPSTPDAAAAAPMALIPEQEQHDEWEPRTGWFMRDTPLSLETVMENVSDPCHAPFTHHGVQGRRENERGTAIRPLERPSAKGFLCEQEGKTPTRTFNATFGFEAPCLIKYKFPIFGRVMAVYAVPSAPGWTRMITRFYKSKTGGMTRGGLFGLFLRAMEMVEGNRVLEHALMRNTVLDGDNYLLHVQERILLGNGQGPAANGNGAGHAHAGPRGSPQVAWREQYFMPGKFDTGVSCWRSWLDSFGRDFPLLPRTLADLPPEMPRRQVLDRYSQHTQHCPDCSRALKRIDAALPLLAAASIALLLAAALALATGAAPAASGRVLGCAAGAAVTEVARRKLQSFRELFVFRDYVHAEKN